MSHLTKADVAPYTENASNIVSVVTVIDVSKRASRDSTLTDGALESLSFEQKFKLLRT